MRHDVICAVYKYTFIHSFIRYTAGNFNENPSMRELAKILRARASEHSSKFCEQFEQRPSFASTFKLNGIIRYLLPSQPKWIRRNNSLPSCECLCGTADYSCYGCKPLAVRHNCRREVSPFWLAVLLEDAQIEVNGENFLQQWVSLRWLNQTSDSLTYTSGDVCNGNSPKSILTRVL